MMTPAEELVSDLEKLRILLNRLSKQLNESGVERTFHLRRMMGKDCTYYRKSLALFEDKDFEPIRNLVADCNDQFILIEGKVK